MKKIFEENADRLRSLANDSKFIERVNFAVESITTSLKSDGVLMVFGNGGSASDALHISAELVGKFYQQRKSLNVICLNSNVSVLTAWSNDFSYDGVFSRQIEAHGRQNSVVWGLSTSGNSASIVNALKFAKELGITTIAMTGEGGGDCSPYADVLLTVPAIETPRVQELHVPIYHFMCQEIERKMSE